jgi:hypothetical protein
MCSGGAGTPKAGGNIGWEWTLKEQAEEGGNAGEAQERRTGRPVQGESWRAEGGAKLMEDASGVHRAHHDGSDTGRPQGPNGDVKGRRGSSKGPNELLLRPTGCGPTVRENGVSVPSLEGQANTMSAVVAVLTETNGFRTSNL